MTTGPDVDAGAACVFAYGNVAVTTITGNVAPAIGGTVLSLAAAAPTVPVAPAPWSVYRARTTGAAAGAVRRPGPSSRPSWSGCRRTATTGCSGRPPRRCSPTSPDDS